MIQWKDRLLRSKAVKCKCVLVFLLSALVLNILWDISHTHRNSWLVTLLDSVAVTRPSKCHPNSTFQPHLLPVQQYDGRRLVPGSLDVPDTVTKEGYLVPNIVHYIWFAQPGKHIKFYHMLSILSAHKYLKPDVIYFHTNNEPVGEYWDRVKTLPELRILPRNPTNCLYDEPINNPVYETSASDVDRVTVLMERGGIYLDLDMLVVQSFDPLRKYPCAIGEEDSAGKVNAGVVVCNKHSAYLKLWLQYFIVDYKVWWWAYNSGWVPTWLAKRYPNLIHVDKDRLQKPGGDGIDKIWGQEEFDWRRNYAIHLLFRTWKAHNWYMDYSVPDEEYIKRDNSSFSQMARRILYE